MKILLLIVAMMFAWPDHALAQKVEAEIPFTVEKGHIIVPATIKGKEPVELVLSSGSERSLIGVSNIKKYNLPVYYAAVGVVTGRNDATVNFAQVNDVKLGNLDTKTVHFLFGEGAVSNVSKRVGREVFGVLGADFFKGRTVQFDFKNKVVRFLSNWSAPKDESEQVAILPMNVDSLAPVRRPIVEHVTFNGKSVKTLVDTGALTVVSLTPKGAKEIGLPVPGDKSDPQQAKLALAFNKIAFTDVPALVHPKDSAFDKDSKGYSAMVGIAVLQNFVVTIAFGDGVVVLERL